MMADTRGRRSTGLGRFWQNYNLSIILSALFLVAWGLQTWAGWVRFSTSQEEHQQVAEVFGHSGYVFEWLSATMENWQSEFLQPLTFVVLTASFIHKGSHESKDSDEELKATLQTHRGPGRGSNDPTGTVRAHYYRVAVTGVNTWVDRRLAS